MSIAWYGITQAHTLNKHAAERAHSVSDAAKRYDWRRLLAILSENMDLVNATRPGGSSLYSPLHQVAHGGAPIEVAQQLIEMQAWRTLQNARGERPVDVAERNGHYRLTKVLTPELKHTVPHGILQKIQNNFHIIIRGRVSSLIEKHSLRLPELETLLEMEKPEIWFQVPGMYGGFEYCLESTGVNAKLISTSWCRVVSGSGERHEITSAGSKLVEEGFV